jgi:glycosyltransferase involved in cell wall biosynthesis
LRILVATAFLPHEQAAHGGGVYLRSFLSALAEVSELRLVSLASAEELGHQLPTALAKHAELVCHPQLSDLGALGKIGHRLRMARLWGMHARPLLVAKFWSPAMASVIRKNLQSFRPDVCLLEMDLMAQYLPLFADQKTVLVDHEAGSPVPLGILGGLGRSRDARLWDAYVQHYFPMADLLQTLNAGDAEVLSAKLERPVEVRPPLVDLPEATVKPGEAAARILFMGDFSHHPNPEAACFVARELLPLLRERVPEAELLIAGRRAGVEVQGLAELPGVKFLGFVEDLAGLLGQLRCLVSPLFSGRGSRIKVLTALAHGLPVVSNELGSLGVSAGAPGMAKGETAEELTRAILPLLSDAESAAQAGRAARVWAEEHLDARAVAHGQVKRYAELLE